MEIGRALLSLPFQSIGKYKSWPHVTSSVKVKSTP